MYFTNFILEGAEEAEMADRTKEVKNILSKIADPKIKKAFLSKSELFGLKNSGNTLQYNSNSQSEVAKLAGAFFAGKEFEIPTNTRYPVKFRQTENPIYLGNAAQSRVAGLSAGNTTKYQEIGPLIYLAMMEDCGFHKNELDISKAEISKLKRVKTGDPKDIEETIKFLTSDKSWDESCKKQAIDIRNGLGSLKAYEFHHGTSKFRQIKRLGKELSNVSEDKWNPADIFLISPSANLSGFSDIGDYNAYVGAHKDIIGISLKKGESDAKHGKFAIENVYKLLGLKIKGHDLTIKDNRLNDSQVSDLSKILRDIRKIKSNKIMFCVTRNGSIKNGIKKNLQNSFIDGKNYGKSYHRVVSFISNFKTEKELSDMLFLMLEIAKSQSPVSCSHYKWASKFYEVSPGLDKSKFEFVKLRVPIDGDMSAVAEVIYESHRYKMQFRSFGSLPQVEIISLKKEETQKESAIAGSVGD